MGFDALRTKALESINRGCEEGFSELNGTQAYTIVRNCTRPCARWASRSTRAFRRRPSPSLRR